MFRHHRPLLISFSGLDGAGKTTQISNLMALLTAQGQRVRRMEFWDDVVVAKRYRESFVHWVYNSQCGIGAPGQPVARRDKNMRGWHLTWARHFLYLFDTIHLRRVLAHQRHQPVDVVLMDRYIYDELVNLTACNPIRRAFVRLTAWIAPRPDLALLLDADPDAARARKPEYPLEFMRECRGWYQQIAALLGTLTIVPPLPLDEAHQVVAGAVEHLLADEAGAELAQLRAA